ncbi:unnamed protein product [marine sediment metagenome]|uniref:Uncharacterized protein n=1 Tax=marine sediment metagenome TaxID=412755 RepID=X1MGA9_9ZZZZ
MRECVLANLIPANWIRVTKSQIINDRAEVLYGIQVYSLATGDTLVVHDGQNASAPVVFTIDVPAGKSKNLIISRGILLVHGLYVALGTNITEATIASLPYQEPIIPSGERRGPGG